MEELSVGTVVAGSGFIAGIVFGFVVNRTNFCTMGALSDAVFMENFTRLRAWFLAIAVAMIGTQALHAFEVVDIYRSIYLTPNLGLPGAILGGLMFGFGMTMAGGCANRTLVRIGAGNLKSIVVIIVMGIFAYMTLRGLTGLLRVEIENMGNVDLAAMGLKSQGMGEMIAAVVGAEAQTMSLVLTVVFAGALLFYCFKDQEFRESRLDITAGVIVGAMVPVGWWITGVLGYDDFDPAPLMSFSFVSPSGNGLQYLMTFTGSTINFGIATIGGIIVGSFIAAVATKTFRVETFTEKGDLERHMFGAAIMGMGGIMALGCTIGQGITGMSTLALGSLLALLSILFGGVLGLKYLEEGSLIDALKALAERD